MKTGLKTTIASLLLASSLAVPAIAQNAAFEHGWTLNGSDSHLNLLTVKKGKVMEVSSFATLEGEIDEAGAAEFRVLLESVDTKVDLRNVRMRFLLLETFNYPEATVSAQLDAAMLEGLEPGGLMTVNLPFTLDLHGVTKSFEAEVAVKLVGQDDVMVSSIQPIVLHVEDFNLLEGIAKLEETANVDIVPTTAITFSLNFDRNATSAPMLVAEASKPSVALETAGELSKYECLARFETLSVSNSISFTWNSADLTASSTPVLDSVTDIVQRCPGMVIEIAGHTDNTGRAGYNTLLSQRRAAAVVDYFVGQGVAKDRLISRGYGEARPIASNATDRGRSRNRRIEFSVVSFDTASR